MKFDNKKVLVLALAAGLVFPVANASAASPEVAALNQELDQNTAEIHAVLSEEAESEEVDTNVEDEEIETLSEDSELIYTTTIATDGEGLDDRELADQIIDEINATTALIDEPMQEEDEEESILSATSVEATYIFNGQTRPVQTLQIVDSVNGPLANVVSIREYAYALANTDFKFDVKTNGAAFLVTKGINYNGGATKKFEDLTNASVEAFTGTITVDGKATEISGYFVDGEPMVRASVLSRALDLRFRNDVKDSSKLLINTDKSDIKVPTVAELDEEIKKRDYTVLFNWGPWCPWSKHEIPLVEKFAQYLGEQNKYDIQILGLVDESENYSNEELSVLFHNNKSLWKNFGTDDELRAHVNDLLGYRLQGFPTTFIVNKNLEKMGEEFYDYYDTFLALYLAENNLTEEDYEELYLSDFDKMEEDDKNKETVYSNFLRYAIEGEEVSLADSNVLKEVTVKNEDKAGWEKDEAVKAPEKKEAKKENKAPKSSNPKTGVTSVAGAVAMAGIAVVALKKTKRN